MRRVCLSLLMVAGLAVPARASSSALPFISDDYAAALAKAKADKRPLFVEFWAPWCHTCRSMRAFVLTDESLTRRGREFVWLDIDTDKPTGEAVLERFPLDVWPTFRVIDAAKEEVILERVGSLTVGQMHAFLDEAQAAFAGRAGRGSVDLALGEADRLAGQRRYADAAISYRKALDAAPPVWAPRTRVMEAELFAHQAANAPARCAQRAVELLDGIKDDAARLSVAGAGLQCAVDSPAQTPGRDRFISSLEPTVRDLISRSGLDLAADDVSGFHLTLATVRKDARDEPGRRRDLLAWVAFLEARVADARTAEQRAVFDSHRLTAYLELGTPERALEMLQASERDLPADYNPPARLAVTYVALSRWNEAVAASDRALSRVQGPRRLRILRVKAEALEGKGDKAGAITVLEEAVAFARRLEVGDERIAPLTTKIEALRQTKPVS
jgi:thiol-disulfide isomerase/thioredoxin